MVSRHQLILIAPFRYHFVLLTFRHQLVLINIIPFSLGDFHVLVALGNELVLNDLVGNLQAPAGGDF